MRKFVLLGFSLLLILSGTASAAIRACPAMEEMPAVQAEMGMHDHCDMDIGAMEMPAPDQDMQHLGDTACCCPAIIAALPGPALPENLTALYPPIYDSAFTTLLVSLPSVPEPPPPRA